MKVYKLTDEDGRSHGGTQWGEGVTHHATGKGVEFCTSDLLHFYSDPYLALLWNPVHADIKQPVVWDAEADIVASYHGLKLGAKSGTTIRRLAPQPVVTTEQRVRFAILCVRAAYGLKLPAPWREWAEKWLSGEDRTLDAAWVAARAAAEWEAAEEATNLDLASLAIQVCKEITITP